MALWVHGFLMTKCATGERMGQKYHFKSDILFD